MAVVSVEEQWAEATAEGTREGRTATRVYTVLCDDGTDGPVVARAATGIPRVGDAHPQDSWLKCSNIRAVPVGPLLFKVYADYEVRFGDAGQGESPLDQAAEHEWFVIESVEPIDEDADGNPIVNAVNEAFDPPIQREFADPAVRITRNEATFSASNSANYANKVNSDSITIDGLNIGPGYAKMKSITGTSFIYGSETYYRVTYTIHLRAGGWQRRVLNQGYRYWTGEYLDDGSKQIVRAEDANGQPLSHPVLLAADGKKLPDGGSPVWLSFDVYEEIAFGPLNLT